MNDADAKVIRIQQHYGIQFPQGYLDFIQLHGGMSFDRMQGTEVQDWDIRFHLLDDQFIANNAELVDEVNPDPQWIIPIVWSVSSGNNYLLDYRQNKETPSVLFMEHELAMVREDAESEADTSEEAQRFMEENVQPIATHFEAFVTLLQARPSLG
ncbi:SMI1/KNR4 family protein [Paenibacillus barcinonensis]|uniref:SMI1/KNR4 family protein n=2 Tax=Paenibacillus barcinonensis TaxID=198119 RepID=A0A2V4VX20_PAEBA|nr:SMI1/KNR4 family protein SUKH-1 [Paenibacillus barcinonensis]QKS60056.1 SMI1/KNR4 family protein [Paenibacillus barcinonensis]